MKENQLQTYANEMFGEVRGLLKDGEPWFLAGNVCRALGIKNSRDALRSIKTKRKNAQIKGVVSTDILVESPGGSQKTTIIPERILYELIFQSRKQKAYLFQTWIFDEVLPSLRKHGEYRMTTKLITNNLHDGIKEKIVPQIQSENGKKFIYSNFHKIINRSLGLPQKNNRDELSDEILEKLAHRENLVKALIDEGKNYSYISETIMSLGM